MKRPGPWRLIGLLMLSFLLPASDAPVVSEEFPLWEGEPPLALPETAPESYLPPEPGTHPDITRLARVSRPTLTLFHPPPERRVGTAVLVCPGGGYHILAMKHEGTQVAEWLNSLGVTAALLKYRVPAPPGEPAHRRPLLDAQRAMSLLRARAAAWGFATNRVGVLGFSAGGHLAAWLLCEGNRRASGYPETLGDDPACRPDFGILIYPAYLPAGDGRYQQPVIQPEHPPGPVFLVHAADDRLGPENSIEFFLALRRAGVPAELHVFQTGGHGFGMLRQGLPVQDWPARCADWLRAGGWLTSAR